MLMTAETNELEKLVTERRQMLLWAIPGGVLFLGVMLAQYAFPQLTETRWFAPVSLVCSIPFLVWCVRFPFWMWRAYRNRPAWKALNDERIEENRRRGWTAGFWAMYISQGIWIAVFSVKPSLVAPIVVAIATIFIGFTVSLIVFFRREELPSGSAGEED